MQIAPPSWRAWWNAQPAACSAWVARKLPLPRTPNASRTPSAASVRPTACAAFTRRRRRPRDPSHRLPFAGAAPHLALVGEPLGLQLEARQRPGCRAAHAEAQALVRLGQLAPELLEHLVPAAGELHLHLDLVADPVGRVEPHLELLDVGDAANDRLDRAGVDVGAADDLHVVHAPADAAVVDVERAPAVAAACLDLADQVARPVAQDGDEPASERGHHALAEPAVADRLAGRGIDDLLDVVVLDDVRPARLMGALEHHHGAEFGHAGGVTRLGAPLLLDQRLGRGDRAG